MNISDQNKFGSFPGKTKTFFNFFAPEAILAYLVLFDSVEEYPEKYFELTSTKKDIWNIEFEQNLTGKYYGFKVIKKDTKQTLENLPLIQDPYARAVSTFTTYLNPKKSLIVEEEPFNWEDDKCICIEPEDLIIYETHLRDQTAHSSSGSEFPGTYSGFKEKGIPYLKELGVNAVEFLPLMEFGYFELPYNNKLIGKFNTWNPYERNHWGYMTSNFFSPSAYYSMPVKELPRNTWIGKTPDHIGQLKNLIKELHKNNIAVILDVVYNHLSEYEEGNFKQINIPYFFRTDADGHFTSESFCGNDLKTESPFVSQLIIDSLIYWITEFHIDGFRFDLGNLIDNKTLERITVETKKINPGIILIAEPWGGKYEPRKFSKLGWGSWNDQIRNGVKGENPFDGQGWIFGKWFGKNNLETIKNFILGSVEQDNIGIFQNRAHSVNYLESHDGFTFGDFIRLATSIDYHDIIKDKDKHCVLTKEQLKLNKLGALFLFVSQGSVMIHSGQEFARSKVIEDVDGIDDKYKLRIDHNSYEKDNNTNYINYEHKNINIELFNYYSGLIKLRNNFKALRKADIKDIKFHELIYTNFALAFSVNFEDEFLMVILNADQSLPAYFNLPEGVWTILVDNINAGIDPLGTIKNKVKVPPVSGMVLQKIN